MVYSPSLVTWHCRLLYLASCGSLVQLLVETSTWKAPTCTGRTLLAWKKQRGMLAAGSHVSGVCMPVVGVCLEAVPDAAVWAPPRSGPDLILPPTDTRPTAGSFVSPHCFHHFAQAAEGVCGSAPEVSSSVYWTVSTLAGPAAVWSAWHWQDPASKGSSNTVQDYIL